MEVCAAGIGAGGGGGQGREEVRGAADDGQLQREVQHGDGVQAEDEAAEGGF